MKVPRLSDKPNMSTRALKFTAAACVLGWLTACSGTNFSADSSKKGKTSDATKGKTTPDKHTDEVSTDNDTPDTGSDPDDRVDQTSEEALDECLNKKADNFNINLIFDNSGSQVTNDPNNIRAASATEFVEQFSRFVGRNKKSRVYFSVLSFNTRSIRSGKSWIKLSGSNASSIISEIQSATSRPGGGTAYSPVLKDSAIYFSKLAQSVSSSKAKNYVVFLTDGLPNAASAMNPIFFPAGFPGGIGETMDDIAKSIDDLVTQHQVAIIAIASGEGIPAAGESITRSLAKPEVGLQDKAHVGVYKRARTTDDLRDVWKSLFGVIADCD